MRTYTVFAVYEDNLQPYATTVEAGSPEGAIRQAQLQCLEDNGSFYANDEAPDYGAATLVGFQVVAEVVKVLDVDDMPFEIGQQVRWGQPANTWTIKAFNTGSSELCAYITHEDGRVVLVNTRDLTPFLQERENSAG